jgi:histidine triad (HIT) family protein
MSGCIFCKILKGEAETSFVLKNKRVSAFMDINPINKGHVLVVPNNHHERFSKVEEDVTGEMFSVAQKILRAIEKSNIKCEGANLFLSDGEIAGQEVPHSHLHIAPRFKGDGHRMGFSGTDTDEKERSKLEAVAESIRNQL